MTFWPCGPTSSQPAVRELSIFVTPRMQNTTLIERCADINKGFPRCDLIKFRLRSAKHVRDTSLIGEEGFLSLEESDCESLAGAGVALI
jgi:hypothetical protein